MNIGSTTVLYTSVQFETSRIDAGRDSDPSVIGPPSNGREAERTNADKSAEGTEATKNLESNEVRREALNDPNSQLFKDLQALKNRDREVRSHEQTHLAAAGPYALGGPTYQYQRGPDGQRYAVGGHVNIDTAEIAGDPEATLRKAETVRRAALAPAEPSPQDRRVAVQASNLAISAQQDLFQLRQEEAEQTRAETQNGNDDSSVSNTNDNEESREQLKRAIRNTGAVESTASALDLIV